MVYQQGLGSGQHIHEHPYRVLVRTWTHADEGIAHDLVFEAPGPVTILDKQSEIFVSGGLEPLGRHVGWNPTALIDMWDVTSEYRKRERIAGTRNYPRDAFRYVDVTEQEHEVLARVQENLWTSEDAKTIHKILIESSTRKSIHVTRGCIWTGYDALLDAVTSDYPASWRLVAETLLKGAAVQKTQQLRVQWETAGMLLAGGNVANIRELCDVLNMPNSTISNNRPNDQVA